MSKVNLLGYDEFGTPSGMNPLAGLGIAGGLSVLTGAVIRGTATSVAWQQNSDLAAFGVGALTSGVLFATGNEAAAWVGLGTSILASFARWLEAKVHTMPAPAASPAPSAGTAGMGYATVQRLGLPVINQLGMATIDPVKHAYGTAPGAGVAGLNFGSAPPISLLGPGSPQQQQASLMAGPTLPRTHGLASHYGANLFGIGG